MKRFLVCSYWANHAIRFAMFTSYFNMLWCFWRYVSRITGRFLFKYWKSSDFSQMLSLHEGITKVASIHHHQGAINVCTKFQSLTKVMDRMTSPEPWNYLQKTTIIYQILFQPSESIYFYEHSLSFQGILHKGSGENIFVTEQPPVITSIMGNGRRRSISCPSCNGLADGNKLLAPVALAMGIDGSLYVGDLNFVRRVYPSLNTTGILELR